MKKRIVLAAANGIYDRLEEALAVSHGLEVLRVRRPEDLTQEKLGEFAPRYVFFPHWSWRIPPAVYGRFDCVVFHLSDVPFGRGGSPIQNLIVLGKRETQLSAIKCVEELDAGPVYAKRAVSLLGTVEEILLRASHEMEEIIAFMVLTEPSPQPQIGDVTLFKRRKPEDGDLATVQTLSGLHDMIRMLDGAGYPPAFLDVGHFRLEFTRSSFKADHLIADVRISRRT